MLVADTLREVVSRDRSKLTADVDLSSSFIVGGQIAVAGPWPSTTSTHKAISSQATPDTPFLQLGESKYGRPILDRNLDYRTPLDEALRCGPDFVRLHHPQQPVGGHAAGLRWCTATNSLKA